MLHQYVSFSEKINCCGCSGCLQACPVKCISMRLDSEGFLYPEIDESRCIHCNKCNKVCPVLNSKNMGEKCISTYVAVNKNDEERLSSSSGGIFDY